MSAELMRLLSNIIRTGIISEVDEESWCGARSQRRTGNRLAALETPRARETSTCGFRHHQANRWQLPASAATRKPP
ncbi:baseplate assembly protein V [Escherichia coli]|nr:baseplate assembly protein V [Escherichia coli]